MELQDYVTTTYPEDSYRSVGFTSVLHDSSFQKGYDVLIQNCYISSRGATLNQSSGI